MNYLALLEAVKLFEKLSNFDEDYIEYVLKRRQTWENVNRITEAEIKKTVIEFLKRWKIRNVNMIVPHELKEVLKKLSKHFEVLRSRNLIDFDFKEEINIDGEKKTVSEIIEEIYKELLSRRGIGPTSASKIMHCIIPELFMMWDEGIRNAYGYVGNEVGYLKFMRESQRILKSILESYGKSRKELCHEAYPMINKTLVKLLDEFNYMRFTKGENLPNPAKDF